MYILSAALSEQARQLAVERITRGITERQGRVVKVFDRGRRKLTYAIRGQREGYEYVLYFAIDPTLIDQLWQDYHLNEDLLRFITLSVSKVPQEIAFPVLALR